jgi:3-deoxy-7-phosphoheptulonate synthase
MVVVMQEGASEAQIQHVMERLVALGFDIHRSTGVTRTVLGVVGGKVIDTREIELIDGVGEVVRITAPYKLASRQFNPEGTCIRLRNANREVEIGGNQVVMMAGPCSVESQEQMEAVSEIVARCGAPILRGGAFKPRSSPYSFQGMGAEGLQLMRRAADRHGLFVISEVMDQTQIPLLRAPIFYRWVRAICRTSTCFASWERCASGIVETRDCRDDRRVALSAEYILAGGNHEVILCERGIRTFENYTRNTLDISAIPVVKKLSHLPIVVDPSHGTGRRDKVPPMARAAVAAGADGLLVEVHPNPEKAVSDGAQTLFPDQFEKLMKELKQIAPVLGRTI